MSRPDATRVEHAFRHRYAELVAALSRRVGLQHIAAIEDAAQDALLRALETWPLAGAPDNPAGWLFRVAQNRLLDDLRRQTRRADLQRRVVFEAPPIEPVEPPLAGELGDDLLRMLFVCCDPRLPTETARVLALKLLCGFEVREIAQRLSMGEGHVYKRLSRGRQRLRALGAALDVPPEAHRDRLPAVRAVLYLLFTEGHLSLRIDAALRAELCDEAIRLTTLLAEHAVGRDPETAALTALMHLHRARMPARLDGDGGLLLLAEQDRGRWDAGYIAAGLRWLAASAEGERFTRYHAEAGIAAEHCLASSLAETRWGRIVESYALLDRLAPSPMHTLNRALAMAEWKGPAAGLALLDGLEPPARAPFGWSAALADLHLRCGQREEAARHRARALQRAPTPAIRTALARRLADP